MLLLLSKHRLQWHYHKDDARNFRLFNFQLKLGLPSSRDCAGVKFNRLPIRVLWNGKHSCAASSMVYCVEEVVTPTTFPQQKSSSSRRTNVSGVILFVASRRWGRLLVVRCCQIRLMVAVDVKAEPLWTRSNGTLLSRRTDADALRQMRPQFISDCTMEANGPTNVISRR